MEKENPTTGKYAQNGPGLKRGAVKKLAKAAAPALDSILKNRKNFSPKPPAAAPKDDPAPETPKEESVNKAMMSSWVSMRSTLSQKFGHGVWNSWLKHLTYHSFRDGILTLATPTPFLRDWVTIHYLARLLSLARQMMGEEVKRLEIFCRDAAWSQFKLKGDSAPPTAERKIDLEEKTDHGESFGTSAALNSRFTFDNFVVGKSNELAFAAARRVATADKIPFNPLFLYGGVGLGKTHLMHAIAWAVSRRSSKKQIMYISAEKFMYQFIRSIRFRDTIAFKEKFRSVDFLMVDDVQFIAGDATREEFFHTFNALVDQKRQIIISADKSPDDLKGMEERMRSRLGGGLVADIHPATYELRLSILQNKAAAIGLSLDDKVYDFVARSITNNIRVLEGALHKIAAHARFVDKALGVEDVSCALRDVIKGQEREVTIDHIQRRVAEHYNVRLSDMVSARRTRNILVPRQVAMYLVKQLTPRSLPEIGRHFGNRDHTTVMHAVGKIENLKVRDSRFEEDLELLRRTLGG